MKRILLSTLFFLSLSVITAQAALTPAVKDDFSPLEGVIIMPIGDEYLIDLDMTSGIKEGDILTLISDGEKIIHPVTKEILGTLEIPQGFLQVTRVKSGYSYARRLSPKETPAKGDRIKRFEQVPATTDSSVPDQLAKELKNGLPQLNWEKAGAAAALLKFSFAGNLVTVTGPENLMIKKYRYTDGVLSEASSATTRAADSDPFSLQNKSKDDTTLLNRTMDDMLTSIGLGNDDQRLEQPGIIRSQQTNNRVWMAPPLPGSPVGITVDDFDNDGKLETAIAFNNELLITRIDQGKLLQLAKIDFPAGIELLSVDSLDLDNNGFPEIILSAVNDTNVSSQIIEFTKDRYQRTVTDIDWFLRVVEFPDKGKILAGQALQDRDMPFSSPLFQLYRKGDELKAGEQLDTPPGISVFSFIPFKDENGNTLFAYISTGDILSIATPEGQKFWESSDSFGGSETKFYTSKEMNNELLKATFIQQRLLKLPDGGFLTAQNEGSRAFMNYRNFDKSRVLALRWSGFAPQEIWRTADQAGSLGDYTLADADNDGDIELVMAMKFNKGTILQKSRSTIAIYELNE